MQSSNPVFTRTATRLHPLPRDATRCDAPTVQAVRGAGRRSLSSLRRRLAQQSRNRHVVASLLVMRLAYADDCTTLSHLDPP